MNVYVKRHKRSSASNVCVCYHPMIRLSFLPHFRGDRVIGLTKGWSGRGHKEVKLYMVQWDGWNVYFLSGG